MWKVKIFIFIVLVNLTLGAVLSRDPHRIQQPNRRVESISNLTQIDKFFDAIYTQNDFFDSLYNRKGKTHNIGSDFGLTGNLYNPNPIYTKKVTSNSGDEDGNKFWYPVFNNNLAQNYTDTQDIASSASAPSSELSLNFNPMPSGYDAKTHTYTTYHYPTPPATYLPLPSSMPTYGPPLYPSTYPPYVPHASYGPMPYFPSTASPHSLASHEDKKSHESWFIEKLLKKFDLVLMSKLLLKFIIFKKIVKFIAIICLLLFIPSLKKKFEEVAEDVSSEEERKGRKVNFLDAYANTDFRVKEIANFALTAIEGFESHQIPWCVGESEFYCRFQYMLDSIDLRYPLIKIPQIWFPSLTTTPIPVPEAKTKKSTKDVKFNDFITESPDSSSIEVTSDENGDNEIENS